MMLRDTEPQLPTLQPMPREAEMEVSFAQERLWFLDQLQPGSPFYNIPAAVRLRGQLNPVALHASLNAVVARHEALRTTFTLVDGQPRQTVAPALFLPLPVRHLDDLPHAQHDLLVQQHAQHEAQQPFDLQRGPLLRATLLQLAPDEHILLLTLHHIIADGWSMGVLVYDLVAYYQAAQQHVAPSLPPLPIQYPDYALWQRQLLQGAVLARQLAYWRAELADAPPLLTLPTDHPRPAVQSFAGAKLAVALPAALSTALQQLSQREGVTLFMTLLTAFGVLLGRYSRQDDLVIGAPIANRTRAEIEPLIGFFVNTLALRVRLHDQPSFLEQLRRVREMTLAAYVHQELPFERLVAEIAPPRDLGYQPLFQVMFILQNTPSASVEIPGLTITPIHSDNNTAKFDLTLELHETPEGIQGTLEYSTAIFEAATIRRMIDHFETLLTGIVAEPLSSIAGLPLLNDNQRQQILTGWNETAQPYINERSLHQRFEDKVARTPDAVAVIDGPRSLSYLELDQRANQLAHYLQRHTDGHALDELCVGVYLPRSLEFVIAVLGVLKAGGMYLPLDPSYPVERLRFMLADARAAVLLTSEQGQPALATDDLPVIRLDGDWPAIALQPTNHPDTVLTLDSAAYLIYTSGSTGRPKGVVGLHRGLVNRLSWMENVYPFTADEVCCQKTAISFVDSVTELWGPLLAGVPLVLIDDEVVKDPPLLLAVLAEQQVTRIVLVPSLLRALLEYPDIDRRVPQLRLWISSGEALSAELWQQFQTLLPGRTLLNLYGSSEVAADATAFDTSQCSGDVTTMPIGRPIANTQVYLLDEQGEPAPVGVPGEIYVGGAGLARGYLGQAALTATRFVPNPFADSRRGASGTRLYRTSDLGRYRPDRSIEYLGRIDQQIKIRGVRVEPDEVAAALIEHPAIQDAAVIARAGRTHDMELVAYVVAVDTLPGVPELRAFLATLVPTMMVPAAFIQLDALPYTPNGKLDRRRLAQHAPSPDDSMLQQSFVAPRNPIEQAVASIWAEVLRRERIGVYNNFFELGGHSLLATQTMSRIHNAFKLELPLRALFEAPTVAGIAERIQQAQRNQLPVAPPLQAVSRDGELPLSFAQQRLWFLTQLEPLSPAYNMPIAVRLCGTIDLSALHHSLNEVVRRHEALRTTFPVVTSEFGTQSVQRIAATLTLALPLISLQELPIAEREQEVQRRIQAEAQQPFDLERGPLLRATLLHITPDEHILLLNMHHIISDGWSLGVFVQELAQIYPAHVAGQPSSLPELAIQYADYAIWQREWLRNEVLQTHLEYWRHQLADAPTQLELPADRPRQATQTSAGAKHALSLPPLVVRGLKALGQQEGATLFMTLLATFQTLLYRYSGQADLVVGVPIANRNRAEIEPLIGFFLNMLALRTDLSGNPSFRELLGRVRNVAISAQDHQDLPFEQLVAELAPARGQSGQSPVQVMFMLRNIPTVALELPGLTMHPIEVENGTTKFDLSMVLWETADPAGEAVQGWLEYSSALFEPTTIARLAEHFQTLVAAVVAAPDQHLLALPLLSDAERRALPELWRGASLALCDQGVHELIAEQAARTPEALAVCTADAQMTYQELDRRANHLAHRLQARGVGPETYVGVCLPRTPDLVVALLAVLKAGGTYIPLDPAEPTTRLALIMEDAQAQVLITQYSLVALLPAVEELICLDTDMPDDGQPQSAPAVAVSADQLAYVVYSAGSIDQPCGVAVTHHNLTNLVTWAHSMFSELELAMVLAPTPTSLDLAIFELFAPLAAGGAVVLAEQEDLLAGQLVTLTHALPSTLAAMIEQGTLPFMAGTVSTAGEPLSATLIEQIYVQSAAERLLQLYGVAEATSYSTYAEIARQAPGTATIGRPLANTQVYVLDELGQAVPVGVTGELYIGGAGVARGYLHQPALTAAQFVPDPFAPVSGSRMYRTGDLARYRADGTLVLAGSIDQRVRMHGRRIAPDEIAAALRQHMGVREVVVGVHSDGAGVFQLVAYVVPWELETMAHTLKSELQLFLEASLPSSLIPATFVLLDELPRTAGGAVDWEALPQPQEPAAEQSTAYLAPRTETERMIAGVWQAVLHLETIGVNDNFFDVGGHSLLMTQVHGQLEQALSVEIPITDLFEYPTISTLAEHISRAALAPVAATPPAEIEEQAEALRMTRQRRRERRRERRGQQRTEEQ